MSVFIRGMKKTKNCFLCPLSVLSGERLFCKVTKEEVLRSKIPSDCPLVELPPHGRLIDADALIKGHFSDEHRIAMSYADKCWMRRIINGEPTIIPAEEEDG